MAPRPWHEQSVEATSGELGVDLSIGVLSSDVGRRRERGGPNVLETRARRSMGRMVLAQLTDFMVLVLLAAAVVSGVVGEAADTIAIIVIVVLQAVLGVTHEWRAERALEALAALAEPHCRVLRDGAVGQVASEDLVIGDVVVLEAGEIVPTDLRVVESQGLQIEESALTGESVPVDKHTEALPAEVAEVPVGDRLNMAYRGTSITRGHGLGLAVATGMRTQLGKIAELVGTQRGPTPLQRRLAAFGRQLVWVVLALCGVVFATGMASGEATLPMLLTAVSLAVAAIPEGLPAMVTIALAFGARRMAARSALVRRLAAVETLGSVTVICTDKTGTLTENRMAADVVWPERSAAVERAMVLCNDAQLSGPSDPMELALLEAVPAAAKIREGYPRVGERPFDTHARRMTTVHEAADGGLLAVTKGAPEAVLDRCGASELVNRAEAAAEELAARGLRVLALAERRLGGLGEDGWDEDLVLLGLVGLIDPPRASAAAAVATCAEAGIRTMMVTGDHPATAQAIGQRVGIDLIRARIDPAEKLRIVEELQAAGEVVAMTGDGVNDAPALQRADVGVAMGKVGTDVAREASELVLLDDEFATIVAAVEEGRRIFDNIRKFLKYSLASNSGEIVTLLLAPLVGLPVPLLPIQILWVNLASDGLPGLALTVEPAEPGVMARPPRPMTESIFAHGLWQHTIWVGLLIGALALGAGLLTYEPDSQRWQTVVLTVLTFAQMGHVMTVRSERVSLWGHGVFGNRPLLGAIGLTLALHLAVVYVPALQVVFRTEALSPTQLALCVAVIPVIPLLGEFEKWLVRRGLIYRPRPSQPT